VKIELGHGRAFYSQVALLQKFDRTIWVFCAAICPDRVATAAFWWFVSAIHTSAKDRHALNAARGKPFAD
jgi:hypothetical protein